MNSIEEINDKIKEANKARSKFMSNYVKGSNNPRWNGGNSEYPDHAKLKKIRIKVLQRAKGKCEICGKLAKIVHHINEDKSNHLIDNLIALCNNCHISLHRDDNGKYVGGRPTSKHGLVYNKTLKEISIIFGVSTSTIWNWIKTPKKKEWLEKKLKDYYKGEK